MSINPERIAGPRPEPIPEQRPEPNFKMVLKDIYPGVTDEIVNNIIQIVEEDDPLDSNTGKLEKMVNLLSEYGAWGPAPSATNEELVNRSYECLMELFPDANPEFMLQFCQDQSPGFNLEEAVQKLFTEGYDKVELDPLLIWEQLKDALPDADPLYLKEAATRLVLQTRQDMDNFLQNAIEKKDYPTMKDYLQQITEQDKLAIYKEKFNVDKFLEIIPNPVEVFSSPDLANPLDENASEGDVQYALTFLYNNYSFIRKKYIDQLFKWKKRNLIEVCARLDKMNKSILRPRPPEGNVDTKNEALLQEIAYLKNKTLINRELKLRSETYRLQKEEARQFDLLQECQCCFEEELIPEECYFCMRGCIFCKECVRKGTETAIGKGDVRFPCFCCDSEFSYQTLQRVLPKNLSEKLVQKIASEEVKKANIEGFETCPFCNFAMIPPKDEKIFKCVYQPCRMESCRECRHKSHVPLRCNEIEYDEDVRRRTFIENKMTEALTRTCHKCKKVFIKETGCNKMTCQCGAKQCYLCGAAIDNYSHFTASGCALFTNDKQINLQRVVSSARNAKQQLGNVQIKFDPSANIDTFFN